MRETTASLRRKISGAGDLQSVVSTMELGLGAYLGKAGRSP